MYQWEVPKTSQIGPSHWRTSCDVDDYENSKYLYQSLKMRNFGDLDDLYKAKDVILLCEIIGNHFQAIQYTFVFSPSKCNSASSMSGKEKCQKLY